MPRDGLPQEFVTFGPKFPGLDEWNEPGSTGGARAAKNTRRDGGNIVGMPIPLLFRTDGGGWEDERGIECHTKADATPIILSVSGTAILTDDGMDQTARVEPNRPLFWDGSTVNIAGKSKVVMVQNGARTYICDTGL